LSLASSLALALALALAIAACSLDSLEEAFVNIVVHSLAPLLVIEAYVAFEGFEVVDEED
jgi:hypothetical protein